MNIDHIVNKILNEITNTYSRGGYDYPLQNKIRKFKKTSLDPFNFEVNLGDDPEDEIKKNNLNEDLAVWFGKKKKPKGSKQPKGPWVDICRKVNGKHPPCGRKDSDIGSYPKCRGAHAAGKMSPEEKRRACRQKRSIERKDTQRGKGQKPNWVSHKKKKKKTNENMKTRIVNLNENDLMRIVKRVLNESTESQTDINNSSDWPRWLKRKRYGSDLQYDKNPGQGEARFGRKMYFYDDETKTITYDTILYGYDNLNKKIVQAVPKNRGGARDYDNDVTYYCDENITNIGKEKKGYVTTSGVDYFDIPKQQQSDKEWLIQWCKKIPKRSLVKTKDNSKFSMNSLIDR